MNFQQASELLTGRCSQSRKLANNTWLERRDRSAIAVRLHSTDILIFFEDGRIEVSTGRWDTMTTRNRMNKYLPEPWHVYAERLATILSNVAYWHQPSSKRSIERVFKSNVVISPNGHVEGGQDAAEFRAEIQRQDRERARLASRARYWIRAARGMYRDSTNCTEKTLRCGCHARPFHRPREIFSEPGQCQICGCRFIRRPYRGKLTILAILAEENITIRMAMIRCYGLERFLLEAGAKIADEKAGYQLLEFPLNNWRSVMALKMICPSTRVVYVSPVDPRCDTVPTALDWMFDTDNYLGRVQQSA